jgi:TIR domain
MASVKKWDVFISHASEDKDDVAILLAQALRRGGVEVWLDQQELRLGDSLREKIDAGLANSRFGAVILSPNFLAKDWPRQELNALVAIEDANKKVILPVWHRIDKKTLAAFSPILADRIAEDTANGIDGVASKIMQVVFEADSSEPGAISPRLGQRLLALLKPPFDIEGISEFLSVHSNILPPAFGSRLGWYDGTQDEVLWNQQFGMSRVDCWCRTNRNVPLLRLVDRHLRQVRRATYGNIGKRGA